MSTALILTALKGRLKAFEDGSIVPLPSIFTWGLISSKLISQCTCFSNEFPAIFCTPCSIKTDREPEILESGKTEMVFPRTRNFNSPV